MPTLHALLPCLLLALAAGCAGVHLPKTITEGDITPQRKKRSEEIARQFEKQRDFAEYEAAKTRWVHQRDKKGCREALETLLARKPQHREALLLMAELRLAEDDGEVAYRYAKAALDTYPNDAQVQYTVALTLDAQGKFADALAYYERATRMDPQSETYAAAYRNAKEATREERRLSNTPMPELDESLDELTGECLPTGYTSAPLPPPQQAGKSSGNANSSNSSERREIDGTDELLRRGQAALTEGAPQIALERFRQAAAAKPDNPQIPISAAAAMLRANQPDLAIELLTPAAKRFPRSAAIHRMLGAAHYRAGDFQSSEVALWQALSLDKSSALSYLLMGCALAKLGQDEAAEVHFRQARAMDPKYRAVR